MKIITSDKAPAAIGPYSQAIISGGLLFASGQIPLVPETGAIIEGGIKEQTTQVIKNIEAVLSGAGLNFTNVVKCTCFLKDLNDFSAFNEIYAQYFTGKPARSTIEVAALPRGALVEIEIIAEAS
jgi:2-iminobutanoate/2-iminopropanoate deaminase